MASKPRDYTKEYAEFHGKPEQVKKRAQRVKARRMLTKEGAVTKGDGKDVDHITPLKKNGTTARSNLRVRSVKANRGDKT
jgi:hypothetical protein